MGPCLQSPASKKTAPTQAVRLPHHDPSNRSQLIHAIRRTIEGDVFAPLFSTLGEYKGRLRKDPGEITTLHLYRSIEHVWAKITIVTLLPTRNPRESDLVTVDKDLQVLSSK